MPTNQQANKPNHRASKPKGYDLAPKTIQGRMFMDFRLLKDSGSTPNDFLWFRDGLSIKVFFLRKSCIFWRSIASQFYYNFSANRENHLSICYHELQCTFRCNVFCYFYLPASNHISLVSAWRTARGGKKRPRNWAHSRRVPDKSF